MSDPVLPRHSFQRRKTVDRDPIGFEPFDGALHPDEVILERHDLGIVGHYLQVALLLELLEIEPPSGGIAEELLAALLEAEGEAALAFLDAAGSEGRHHQRIAGSR